MRVSARGHTFRVRVGGPVGGEPVLLLHGFPQHSGMWRAVSRPLHAAGFRTIAPDQRGYSPGARPTGTDRYRISECVADAAALLTALGLESAHVAGHDWGAIVGWFLAAHHPDRVRTLTAASVPHPAAFADALTRNLDQWLRSSYVALFRQRYLAERLLLAFDAALLRHQCTASGLPAAAVGGYVDRLTEPGALTAALAWYRAMSLAEFRALEPVGCPTTFVWSDQDRAIGRHAAERCGEHVTGPYRHVELPGVSHWIADVAPAALASAIIDRATVLTPPELAPDVHRG